jgi:TolB-like protein/class 3 adenylate cyclase
VSLDPREDLAMPTEPSAHTRLLTLVFTDLEASTALKREHGDEAAGGLIAAHRALLLRHAEQCGGRPIDFAGDGCFLTFETPSAAVRFALRLQASHGARPELPRVRTGIHMGEVTEHGGDPVRVEGLAVDLAARIGALAAPGQVLLSSAVATSARQQISVEFEGVALGWHGHGRYELEGAGEALEIVEVGAAGGPFVRPRAGPKARPARRSQGLLVGAGIGLTLLAGWMLWWGAASDAPPIRAIAVLPLENLSGDPAQEYFADGMTDALIAELGKLESLRVISRTSVMRYKGARVPIPELADELGVEGVIEGSVLRDGDRVRVTAQLIDARSDTHLWAESYERELRAVLAIQGEIARAVAGQIQLELAPRDRERLAPPPAIDPSAQDAYFRGLAARSGFTRESVARSIAHFDEAIRLEPEWPLAHAAKSTSHFLLGHPLRADGRSAAEEMPQARRSALRAIELDENLGEGYGVLGQVLHFFDWDWEGAGRAFQRALELGVGDPSPRIGYAFHLLAMRRPDDAFEQIEAATAVAPGDPFVRQARADFFHATGDFERALGEADALLAEDPDYVPAVFHRMRARVGLGLCEEARADLRRLAELDLPEADAWRSVARTEGASGCGWLYRALRTKAEREGNLFVAAGNSARLGEWDAALDALERAHTMRLPMMGFLVSASDFRPLHDEPRFRRLAEQMRLPLEEHP